MAAAVPVVAGIKAVGGAVKAAGILKGGSSAKQAGDINAQIAEDNARAAREKASLEVVRNRRLASKALGSVRAAAGGSGIAQSGSVLDVLEESAALAEEDALLIKHSGEAEAVAAINEGTLQRFYGNKKKSASKISAASSLLNTGANIVGSFF